MALAAEAGEAGAAAGGAAAAARAAAGGAAGAGTAAGQAVPTGVTLASLVMLQVRVLKLEGCPGAHCRVCSLLISSTEPTQLSNLLMRLARYPTVTLLSSRTYVDIHLILLTLRHGGRGGSHVPPHAC